MGKRVVPAALAAVLLLAATGGASPISGSGHLPAPRRGTFVSLWPECACGRTTVLEQFSLAGGRRLGAVARVKVAVGSTVSDPHTDHRGGLWLAFSRGPRCGGPGVSAGPCTPVPDSCSGQVVRFDPLTGASAVALAPAHSLAVTDVIPSPVGHLVALVLGSCGSSFFNEHIVIRDMRSGRQWAIGDRAAPCHALFTAAWSPDGSRIVFPYGPSRLSPQSNFVPANSCTTARAAGLAVVSARRGSEPSQWRLVKPDHGCGYRVASFDALGIAAIESCGIPGPTYLVALDRHRHRIARLKLAPGYDGGDIVADPAAGTVLVSESQAANQPTPSFDWVWAFDGRRLHLVHRYPGDDAATVIAEPW